MGSVNRTTGGQAVHRLIVFLLLALIASPALSQQQFPSMPDFGDYE